MWVIRQCGQFWVEDTFQLKTTHADKGHFLFLGKTKPRGRTSHLAVTKSEIKDRLFNHTAITSEISQVYGERINMAAEKNSNRVCQSEVVMVFII